MSNSMPKTKGCLTSPVGPNNNSTTMNNKRKYAPTNQVPARPSARTGGRRPPGKKYWVYFKHCRQQYVVSEVTTPSFDTVTSPSFDTANNTGCMVLLTPFSKLFISYPASCPNKNCLCANCYLRLNPVLNRASNLFVNPQQHTGVDDLE